MSKENMRMFADKTLTITGRTGSFGNTVLKRLPESDAKKG